MNAGHAPLNGPVRLALFLLLTASPAFSAEPEIVADRRIDLVGLLERLSGNPDSASNPDSDAAVARFERWKTHSAVTRLTKMRTRGFGGGVSAQYALYLSTAPILSEAFPAPDFFARKAGGRAELDAWRADAADFARVTGFEKWWLTRAPRREAELAAVRAAAMDKNLAAPLAKYLGLRAWSSWTVVVSPFFPSGGSASWIIEEREGRPDVIVVYGLSWAKNNPDIHPTMSGGSPEWYASSVLPEAVFSVAYALYEVCRPEFTPSPRACEGMPWLTGAEECVGQSWVRGIIVRILESEYGEPAARAYREKWPPSPFQGKVDAALRAYEEDRGAKPDLMYAAGALLAPFQTDGRPPRCRLIDKTRWQEALYTKRLEYYLEGRLEARPDADLEKVRADLAESGAFGKSEETLNLIQRGRGKQSAPTDKK